MSRGWLQLLPNRGYDPPLGCPAPTSEKTLLLSTRVNKGGGCSSTASPTSYPRYFSATRTPYTLGGRYDAQADSLLPRTPRYLPEDPDGCWAWKDLAVCSERAMPDHPMKGRRPWTGSSKWSPSRSPMWTGRSASTASRLASSSI